MSINRSTHSIDHALDSIQNVLLVSNMIGVFSQYGLPQTTCKHYKPSEGSTQVYIVQNMMQRLKIMVCDNSVTNIAYFVVLCENICVSIWPAS